MQCAGRCGERRLGIAGAFSGVPFAFGACSCPADVLAPVLETEFAIETSMPPNTPRPCRELLLGERNLNVTLAEPLVFPIDRTAALELL